MTQEVFKTDGVFYEVEGIDVTLSVADRKNIENAQSIIRNNPSISSVRVEFDGTVVGYYDGYSDLIEQDDMPRIDVEQFIVFHGGVYYYAQSKYDSRDYIESEIVI
jgi:hypothetical protein